MEIKCPKCGRALELPEDAVGKKVCCAFCKMVFVGEPIFACSPSSSPDDIPVDIRICQAAFRHVDDVGATGKNLGQLIQERGVVENIRNFRVPIILGYDEAGSVQMFDLAADDNDIERSNMLVCGTTGSGKSVFAQVNIACNLLKPERQLKMVVWSWYGIDYNRKCFSAPGITLFERSQESVEVVEALKDEMARRLSRFESRGVGTIEAYNQKNDFAPFPYILVIIDNFGHFDLSQSQILEAFQQVLLNGKATGIHVVALDVEWNSDPVKRLLARTFGRRLCYRSISPTFQIIGKLEKVSGRNRCF